MIWHDIMQGISTSLSGAAGGGVRWLSGKPPSSPDAERGRMKLSKPPGGGTDDMI